MDTPNTLFPAGMVQAFAVADRAFGLMSKLRDDWGEELAERAIADAERGARMTGTRFDDVLAETQDRLRRPTTID